jgi:hypothetical protein
VALIPIVSALGRIARIEGESGREAGVHRSKRSERGRRVDRAST